MTWEQEGEIRYAVRTDNLRAFAEHFVENTNPTKHACELAYPTRVLFAALVGFFETGGESVDFETQARAWAQRNGALALPSAPPHAEEEEQKPDSLLTQREVAELFAVHQSTVSQWEKAGCPVVRCGQKTERGGRTAVRYNLAEVEAWHKERNAKKKGGSNE